MAQAYQVAKNIYLIDSEMYSTPGLTSIYLMDEEKKALIETGPATSTKVVLKKLEQMGVIKDISYIIVTHIHLDHAGSVGELMKEMPQAKVLVHQRGARHLSHPSRLIDSVLKVYGEEGLARYGLLTPVAEDKVLPVADNDVLELGRQQRLKIIYTPGHAPHHICLCEERNKGLFTGDAMGSYLCDGKLLTPNSAPPDFDLELSLDTIDKLSQLPLKMLYFSHFGATRKVTESFRKIRNKMEMWGKLIGEAMAGNTEDVNLIIEKLKDFIYSEAKPAKQRNEALYNHLVSDMLPFFIKGYYGYFRAKRCMKE